MRKLLTPLAIDKLEATASRREIADAGMPGLRLVIQPKPSSTKSWCVRYRYGGRPRKVTLGTYPLVDLMKARERAKDAIEAVERGEDPAAEKKAKKALQYLPASDRDSFGVLIREFFQTHAIPRTRSWQETARLLGLQVDREKSEAGKPPVLKDIRGRLAARWAELPVTSIRRRDIIALLDESKARGATTTANRELSALSKFFSWCCERDILSASPTFGVRKPAPENSRERVLSDVELAIIWKAAVAEGHPFGDLVRLLILTAQRRVEVAGLAWPEIDLVTFTWSLPGSRTKNKRPHLVPLSEAAAELLETIPRYAAGNFLFGLSGRSEFSGFSHAKARLDQRIAKLAKKELEAKKVEPWTLHDIRRTAATRMADLGVMPHIIEAVLNHISGSKAGVAGTYNRSLYEPEKRAALELWANHVVNLVAAKNKPEPEGIS
jgi:integrase